MVETGWTRPVAQVIGGRLLVAALIVATLAGCAREDSDGPPTPSTTTAAVWHPQADLTPGTVLTTRTADVCKPGWAGAHRKSLTAAQKRKLLHDYGVTAAQVGEWDHLVSLELGGGNGPQNIWPQSRADEASKDQFENRLHRQVCAGQIKLAAAQQRIRHYWD